ncbi:PEP-CTERM sorting domain-containing protein [bacterium]|nr:MAG: PEP-CTERM sorting domain-containing protein [bacterium]
MKRLSIICLALVGASAHAAGNLVSNGSFELGTGASATDWAITSTAGVSTVSFAPAYGGSGTSPYGDRFVSFNGGDKQPGGTVSQGGISTIAGQLYRVSFAYGQFAGAPGDQTLKVGIADESTLSVLAAHSYTNMSPSTNFGSIWNRGSFNFVGTGNLVGIGFTDLGTSNTYSTDLVLDDVSIQAVPEPASMAALGFGALAMLRRRRNG